MIKILHYLIGLFLLLPFSSATVPSVSPEGSATVPSASPEGLRSNAPIPVTLTYYNPVPSQCDKDPYTTADGSTINLRHIKSGKHRWCAVSRDLWHQFGCKYKGKPKRIWIEGFGIYEIHDKMNSRFHHRVDLLFHPSDSRKVFKQNVKIKFLN